MELFKQRDIILILFSNDNHTKLFTPNIRSKVWKFELNNPGNDIGTQRDKCRRKNK